MDLLTHIKSKIIILCYAITLSLKYKQVTSLSKYKILLDSVITYVKMETTIIVEHDNAAWRGDVLSYHENKWEEDFSVRYSVGEFPRAYFLPRQRRSPAFLPFDRASRPLHSSPRWTTNTTRRDFWTKCVCRTVVVGKGTLRDPPHCEDGAKTSFVRLFRGKVFRDESTRFAHTNERTNECERRSLVDLGLHFSSKMLVKLPYSQERFHYIVESVTLQIKMQPIAYKHKSFS